MIEQDTIRLLRECDEGVKMGISSIEDVLSHVHSDKLEKCLTDCKKEHDNVISICMGSTSADIEGQNNEMLMKYPIIAVNGCSGGCVNKILENKGIHVAGTIGVGDVLSDFEVSAKDPFRLDSEAEECVKIIVEELNKLISEM